MSFDIKELNASPDTLEQLGTKEKFWFRYEQHGKRWLFKFSRPNTGEHWSEKIAEQICEHLGIPHAKYEIATMNGRIGVVTPNLIPDDFRMVIGNEVLHHDSPSVYPEPTSEHEQFVRIKQHTVSRVLGCLDKANIAPPLGWTTINGLRSSDVFCGFLLLDSLISNQDRHHENWAIVLNVKTGQKYLCETYDHAASLGRELTDREREERLTTNDSNRKVSSFVKKARSEIFRKTNDNKPMLTIDAFFTSVEKREAIKNFWLTKLEALTNERIRQIVQGIPSSIITELAREFAIEMLLENKKRLLEDDRA